MVVRAVGQVARQQEQRHALQAGLRLAARQHHGVARVRVGAEPFVAMDAPGAVVLRFGRDFGGADVRPRALFRHEHGALAQRVEILGGDLWQHALDQRGVAELAQGARQRVRHADRAAQAEFGLHEQVAERVLGGGRHGLGPAQHAAPVRQRGQAKFAVCQPLELYIGRMLVDPGLVGAGAAAHGQGGRMLVRGGGQLVHDAARQLAQPFQMGQQVGVQRGGQVALAERGRVRVGVEQVQATGIRNGGGVGGDGHDGRVHGGILVGRKKMPRWCAAGLIYANTLLM
ncbi:hypothetical protein D3C85_838230 [compost metagenome]